MKKNLPLIIGISLPFIMILAVILVVNVPRAFMNPKYSFLYTVSSYNSCIPKVVPQVDTTNRTTGCEVISYSIENEKLVKKQELNNNGSAQKLYLYDMDRDSTKEISAEEATKYTLSNESRSPDGYEVEYQYGNSGVFEIFGGGNSNARWVIKKGIATKPLSVANSQDRYYYGGGQIGFLGWIIQK